MKRAVLLSVLALTAISVNATIIHVPSDQPTIQAGIDAAGTDDTVLVAPGMYLENIDFKGEAIVLISSGGRDSTFIEPAAPGVPIVTFANGEDTATVLDGFTVRNTVDHSGILCSEADPIIQNCDISFCTSPYDGGGLRCLNSAAKVRHNLIHDNQAQGGSSGGGIGGGGSAPLEVSYNDIYNNTSAHGPGIGFPGVSNVTIHHNLIRDNIGTGIAGGGIYISGSECDIINNTVVGNSKGIWIISGSGVVILNNIVVSNQLEGITPALASVDFNNAWDNGSENNPGPNGISLDPLFTDLTGDDYTLQSGSPCIDAGDPDPQYNDPDSTRNDMGAFPFLQGNQPPVLDSIGPKTVNEGVNLSFIVSATDPDGTTPSLTALPLPLPDGASFVDSGNGMGVFDWTPDYTQAGVYDVTFYATDDSSAVDSEVVPITIDDVNLPPVLDSIGFYEVFEGCHLEFVVTAFDPDGDSLVLSAENLPDNAAFADSGNGHGLFVFDPDFTQSGVDLVTFVASDGTLADSEEVVITVYDGDPIVQSIQIDGQDVPQHVVEHEPVIEWDYVDPTGEYPQTQFEIAVGTDTDWVYAEMWNPEPFETSDTFITYAGAELIDGETYYLRLRVNNGSIWSEWFEIAFRMNSAPTVPTPLHPSGGEYASDLPILWVLNSTDAEGDTLTYDFSGFHDTDCVAPIIDLVGVPETPDSTGGQITDTLGESCIYWWSARAFDGYEYSGGSPTETFVVNATPEPPLSFQALYPPDTSGLPVFDMLTEFWWERSYDPDPLDTVRYKLEIAVDSNFTFVLTVDSIDNESYTMIDSLQFGTHYWWRVTAFDNTGMSTMSSNTPDFWTWKLGDLDHSHSVNIADLTYLVDYLFHDGPPPYPLFIGDMDGNCSVNVADITYLVEYLFFEGPAPKVGCE